MSNDPAILYSDVAGHVPQTSVLVPGQLAINRADRLAYFLNSGGTLETFDLTARPSPPTALVGTTAKPGSSRQYMRADAAPAVDQNMAPIWGGRHIWQGGHIAGSMSIQDQNEIYFGGQNNYTGFRAQLIANDPHEAEVAAYFEIIGNNGDNTQTPYKAALIAHSVCGHGGPPAFGANIVAEIAPQGTPPAGQNGAQANGIEIDINNADRDRAGSVYQDPNRAVALLIGGSGTNVNNTAIEIVGGDGLHFSQWDVGLRFVQSGAATHSVCKTATIWDETSSPFMFHSVGTHQFGLSFASATFQDSQGNKADAYAINLPGWRVNGFGTQTLDQPTYPTINFNASGAGADAKLWQLIGSAGDGSFAIAAVTDDQQSGIAAVRFSRVGGVPVKASFEAEVNVQGSNIPKLTLTSRNAAADFRTWQLFGNPDGSLKLTAVNDANSAGSLVFSATRSGASVVTLDFGPATYTFGAGQAGGFVAFEIGSLGTAGLAFIDFHSSGSNNDFDARILTSGGAAGSNGAGTLTLQAANVSVQGALTAGTIKPQSFTVATLPAPGVAGRQVHCSNARMKSALTNTLEAAGAGSGGIVEDDGSQWKLPSTNYAAAA